MKITYAALALLGTVFSANAFAGCGKPSLTNFNGTLPTADRALAAKVLGRGEAPAPPPGPGPDKPGNIVGLWLNTVSLGGAPIYQSFESFTSDGLEILNDNGSTLNGNVCLGVWSAGPGPKGAISVYHPSWNYDNSGNLIGTVIIKETIMLDPGGNTFHGSVTVDVYDLNNQPQGPQLQASVSGKRISVN